MTAKIVSLLFLLILCTVQIAFADFAPQMKPSLEIRKVTGKIDVDGRLDDPGWQEIQRVGGFTEFSPREMGEPEVKTEAMVTYDDHNLYVAMIMYEDPSMIRAGLRNRDDLGSDDYMGFLFDTYGDASWAYYIFVNPLGVQCDARYVSSFGEDNSFDMLFYSAAKITAEGYQIELKIPFSSLRFPESDQQTWRIQFWNNRSRESRYRYTWAAVSRDEPCFICNFGYMTGLKGIKPGRGIELMPSAVLSQSGLRSDFDNPNSPFDDDDIEPDFGLNARFSPAQDISSEITINPDFSQVESDDIEIDVNTVEALYYPEKRPFFLEGLDLFNTWVDVLYTRSLNDPDYAMKSFGQKGKTSFGYIGAHDETPPVIIPLEESSALLFPRKSYSNLGRLKQTLGDDSYAGLYLSDRRYEGGGNNSDFGADGKFIFLKRYRLEWQFVGSYTDEPDDTMQTLLWNDVTFDDGKHTVAFDGENFWGHALYASIERDSRLWNFDFDYTEESPRFRSDNGYTTRNDSRAFVFYNALSLRPKGKLSGIFDEILPQFEFGRRWNFDKRLKHSYHHLNLFMTLKSQTELELAYYHANELYHGYQLNHREKYWIYTYTRFSRYFDLGLFYGFGRNIAYFLDPPILGKETEFEIWGTFRLFQNLMIAPGLEYARLLHPENDEEIYDGYVFRTRVNYQFSLKWYLRLIVQYDDFDQYLTVEPLLSFKLNPFTIFYAGSNYGFIDYKANYGYKKVSRQFFMKLQYLFRT